MATSSVSFWTPIFDGTHNGFSYAGLKLSEALSRRGVKVVKNDRADIAIAFTPPYLYGEVDADYIIGYTPWETTEIPKEWVEYLDAVDELWTTSSFCKDVLSKYTDKNVEVVLHGVDTEDFSLKRRSRGKPGEEITPLRFLHIGEPAEHKGGQMVYDAFNSVFQGRKDTYLTFKAIDFVSARNREPFGPVTLNRMVTVNSQIMTVEEMNGLMHFYHCLVYPSHGEGFGLIPLQSIFTGMPTILTGWSGMKEFSNYGIELGYTLGPTSPGFYQGLGEWAEPSFEDLCQKMESVYNEYGRYASQAYENALSIRQDERFNWDNIADRVLQLLRRR